MRSVPAGVPAFLLALCVAGAAQAGPAEDCAYEEGDPGARWAACDLLIDAGAQGDALYEALRDRGRAFEGLEDLPAARADYLTARDLKPAATDPLMDLSYVAEAEGNLDEAITWSGQAAELAPQDAYVLGRHSDLLRFDGRFEECLPVAQAGVDAAPEDIWPWIALGNCQIDGGHRTEAYASYEHARGMEGDDEARIHAWRQLSMGAREDGDFARSLQIAEDGMVQFRDSAELLRARMAALIAMERLEDAVAVFEAALEVVSLEEADAIHLRNDLAWPLFVAGDLDRAGHYIRGWAEAHPEPTEAEFAADLDTLGHVRAADGETDAAAEAFLRAAQIDEEDRDGHYRAALAKLGIEPAPGEKGLRTALLACAALGAACRLD